MVDDLKWKWASYLDQLEQTVIIPAYCSEFDNFKKVHISIRFGRLTSTDFGVFVQNIFKSNKPVALNYYGHIKLSTALIKENLYSRRRNGKIRAPMFHFNSIKIEDIEKFNPELLQDFVKFKKYLVDLRWYS